MAASITINLANTSRSQQQFFFFQQQATYSAGYQVYSNSLYAGTLPPFNQAGAMLTFTALLHHYAGVQSQSPSPPQVGSTSGPAVVSQAIDLTPARDNVPTPNSTDMTLMPLGLFGPSWTPRQPPGSFLIITPIFNTDTANFNAGSAVQLGNGGEIVLSNFVTAMPRSNIVCQPLNIFYVQVGAAAAGSVIDITAASNNAPVCDFTSGTTVIDVTYDGNAWSVTTDGPARA